MAQRFFSASREKIALSKSLNFFRLELIGRNNASNHLMLAASKLQSVALEQSILLLLEQAVVLFSHAVMKVAGIAMKEMPETLNDLADLNQRLKQQGFNSVALEHILSGLADHSHGLGEFKGALCRIKAGQNNIIKNGVVENRVENNNLIPTVSLENTTAKKNLVEHSDQLSVFVSTIDSLLADLSAGLAEY